MCIVKMDGEIRHSAWNNKREALHQAEVLWQNGYIYLDPVWNTKLDDFIEFDETISCENGHYYV